MDRTDPTEEKPATGDASQQARHGLAKVETGNTTGAEQLDEAREADPADAEAVEQEASDGPEGRGLSR